MKDFLIIMVVMFGVLFFFRVIFTPRALPPPSPAYRPTRAEIEDMRVKARRRTMLRWFGLALVLIGGVVLAGILKVFDALFTWYGLALVIIIAGVAALILSLRR